MRFSWIANDGPQRIVIDFDAFEGFRRRSIGNVHRVEVEAECAAFTMTIESEPAADNPHSAKIAALSLLATLRGLTATLHVGT